MIPSNRKVGTGLFKNLLEKGKSFHCDSFSFRVATNGQGDARFSVVVAKKVEKSAVGRNSIKRKMYSLIRPHLAQAKPGVHGVFFLKKKIESISREILAVEVESVLKKAGVLLGDK